MLVESIYRRGMVCWLCVLAPVARCAWSAAPAAGRFRPTLETASGHGQRSKVDRAESLRILEDGRNQVSPRGTIADTVSQERVVAAIEQLGRMGEERAVKPLITVVGKSVPQRGVVPVVTCAAVRALGEIGDPRAVTCLTNVLSQSIVVQQFGESPMKLACDALGRIGDKRASPALARLMRKTALSYWRRIHTRAVDALAAIDQKECLEQTLLRLEGTSWHDSAGLLYRVNLLKKLGDATAAPVLAKLSRSTFPSVRTAVVSAFGKIGTSAVPPMVGQLECNSRADRSCVAWVLSTSTDIVPVSSALTNESARVRVGAAWALGFRGKDDVLDQLIAASRGTEPTAAAAIWALGELQNAEAIPVLITSLGRRDTAVRTAAAEALRRFDDARARAVVAVFDRGANQSRSPREAAAVRPRLAAKAVCLAAKPSTPNERTPALVGNRLILPGEQTTNYVAPDLFHGEHAWEPRLDRPEMWSVRTGTMDITRGSATFDEGLAGTEAPWVAIDTWMVIGPFRRLKKRERDRRFGPERDAEKLDPKALEAVYPVADGKFLSWRLTESDGPRVNPPVVDEWSTFYAYAEVYAPRDSVRLCAFGAVDFGKAWVNGRLVYTSGLKVRSGAYSPCEVVRPVRLKQGYNAVLFKIENAWAKACFSMCVCTETLGGL